jgi:hypothetical protein
MGGNALMNGITPISVIDSACTLAFCCGEVSQMSQNVLYADRHYSGKAIGNKARLAVALPARDASLIKLIQRVKDNHDGLRGTEHLEGKHALLFGWAAVNAVEQCINASMDASEPADAALARMHQDGILLNGFSTEGKLEEVKEEDLEALLNAMLTRTITRIHTLKPDSDDGIGWVNRMSAWRRQNVEYTRNYASVLAEPKLSMAGKNFFSEDDRIVQVAIRLQNNEFVAPEEVLDAIGSSGYESDYGRALAQAAQGIIAIDQYLNRELSKTRMREILGV